MTAVSLDNLPRVAFEAIQLRSFYAQRQLVTLAVETLGESAVDRLWSPDDDTDASMLALYQALRPIRMAEAREANKARARTYTTNINIQF